MDEAKEIDHLSSETRTCLENLVRQKAIDRQDAGFLLKQSDSLAALARRLLEDRDHHAQAAWSGTQKLAACQILANGEEPNVEYEAASPAVAAVRAQKERIASLERELEEARDKALEEAAQYLESTFGRCNLLTANGYLNGDDVAEKIRALKSKP